MLTVKKISDHFVYQSDLSWQMEGLSHQELNEEVRRIILQLYQGGEKSVSKTEEERLMASLANQKSSMKETATIQVGSNEREESLISISVKLNFPGWRKSSMFLGCWYRSYKVVLFFFLFFTFFCLWRIWSIKILKNLDSMKLMIIHTLGYFVFMYVHKNYAGCGELW